jgi:hypothetical protein
LVQRAYETDEVKWGVEARISKAMFSYISVIHLYIFCTRFLYRLIESKRQWLRLSFQEFRLHLKCFIINDWTTSSPLQTNLLCQTKLSATIRTYVQTINNSLFSSVTNHKLFMDITSATQCILS